MRSLQYGPENQVGTSKISRGQRCREACNYNGTGKMARAGIVSRGGSYDHLLAVIGAMAEDDIPVPSSGSLYGTVSAYLALCAI